MLPGDKDVDDALCQWFDVGDETRTTFIQHQDDRLACLSQSLDQITLVL